MGSALHYRPFPEPPPSRSSGPLRNRILFLAAAWLIVLMPFLFWRGAWFGRPLSEQQIADYLHDRNPGHVDHALQQIGEQMGRKDPLAANWYPDLLALASSPSDRVRATDAWAMGQDASQNQFRPALTRLLSDESLAVRANAALALAQFGDAAAHDEVVNLLEPLMLRAPRSGRVLEMARAGNSFRPFGVIGKIQTASGTEQITAPWAVQVSSVNVRSGAQVQAGAELATLEPAPDTIATALKALYVLGRPDDLPLVEQYSVQPSRLPERVRKQAENTAQAIRDRSGR